MNRIKITFLVGLIFCNLTVFAQKKQIDIAALISKMSIEEKAGEMTQLDLGVIANGDVCNLTQPQSINQAKLKKAIIQYHIGSFLNVGCGSGTISLENWQKIFSAIKAETKNTKLQIPIIFGIDAIHGNNYTIGATLFPQQIAQAATWNPDLVKQGYEVTAYEARATGIPWNFSPVLDLGRQPLWSRFFETFGEDVLLANKMTVAAINGLQGDNQYSPYHVAACMKHFLGYSMSLSGKDRTPIWLSQREMREYYLPTFKTAIDQGAKTVMINSADINGTPVHANYDILTTLLRKELGFKGVAVTDWEDIYKLVDMHHVAATKKEAVYMAIMAGIDMSMTPNDYQFTDLLIELIKEGRIPMTRIDSSVSRILTLKYELGLFETKDTQTKYPLFGSAEHAAKSLAVASECITLLKNNKQVLPLKNKNESVFVCGPGANSLNYLNGAWTHTWQGVDTNFNTKNKLTTLAAIQKLAGANRVAYAAGTSIDQAINIDDCLAKAKNADKIIICVAETPSTEIPGNIDNLYLPKAQEELVLALSKLNKPIILVCTFNRPRILKNIIPLVDAIVYAYLPGDEGGQAIASVIYGETNPSGKLPFSYPADANSLLHYDRKHAENINVDFSNKGYNPAFDFGFGMSYSNFTYSDMVVSKNNLSDNDSIKVSIVVKNNSEIKGKEVVQIYYADLVASITPSVKKLLAFKKIELKAGEQQTITFQIHKNDLSFVNKQLKRVTEAGEFDLMIQNETKRIYVN